MRGIVGRFAVVAMGLGFAVPAAAYAQGVKAADLVGVWEGLPGVDRRTPKPDSTGKVKMTHAVMMRADSTWAEVITQGQQVTCSGGRWTLSGNTISWQERTATTSHKIVAKDNQFMLYSAKDTVKPVEAYRRADTTVTPKPLPLSAMAQCNTMVRNPPKQSMMGRPAGAGAGNAPARPAPSAAPGKPATPAAPDAKDKAKKPAPNSWSVPTFPNP